MEDQTDSRWYKKLKRLVLDVNPEGVLRDARAAGLEVHSIADFTQQAENYWRIEDLMHQYSLRASRLCALGGGTSGVGGVSTAVALGTADISHIACQLFRLCQRLSILNGFDPENPLQRARAEEIYLLALGFDSAAQAVIRQQMVQAANIAGKRGAYANYILKLIIFIAKKLGANLTSKQAARFIPVVGAAIGAGANYAFASKAASTMREEFKAEYFRTWQATQRVSE